ncbi:hypothetical protein P3T36_002416 [Kitasatospora sp. MAP12-15]|uniref:hypothetical protein n=1 Tax=unclassified Kitasatospora TaxID=2633591 RepID=UPI002474EA9C|nr:hypothetical protein [Kitasatospora sp. MAP12-44]MDH6108663.1 hypothetical protein [Kitasatospora sp. MAP12-44]
MTPDETLRALAALEAAWLRDERALSALAERSPGELSLPVLVAAYGDQILDSLVSLACGIRPADDSDPEGQAAAEERKQTAVAARMTAVVGRTLTTWAASAPESASGDIGRAVIDAVLNFTAGTGEKHVLPLLAALRSSALNRTAP